MDITKLRYFVGAAEHGSFTKAAEHLYTSQPNISKQISYLENELDTKLFIRKSRSSQLTKAGEYLYEQIKDLPKNLDKIFETTRAVNRGDTDKLIIGLLAGQSIHGEIIERFNTFSRHYPELHYALERYSFSKLRDALESYRLDVIITLSFDICSAPDLICRTLKTQEGALFVSRESPMSDLNNFHNAPFVAISPEESYGGYNQLLNFCRKRGFEPNIVRLADSLDNLLFYVEAGIGVTVLDRNTRLETDRNIRIIPIPDSESSDVVAVWLKSNPNPNITKLVDCLKESNAPQQADTTPA